MTHRNALQFINRGMTDAALRDRIGGADTESKLEEILSEEGLSFTPFTFEDAVNSKLMQCRTWEEADRLKDFRTWWELVQQIALRAACSSCRGSD